ncbi:hypothetical protein ABZS74_04790 [Streptomyces microflavus]
MPFRWDWLRHVLTAPIVPALGPVHPHALTVDLFEDTLRAADTGRSFLHYDKARRWSNEKNESVLRSDVDFTTGQCPAPDNLIRPVTDWPILVRETFAPFAKAMASDGLALLHTKMRAGSCGSVLSAADKGCIVGAISPMEVRAAAIGCPQFMPQYCAILPEARGRGLGRAL